MPYLQGQSDYLFSQFNRPIASDTTNVTILAIENIEEDYYILGKYGDPNGLEWLYVSKLNSLGELQWFKPIDNDSTHIMWLIYPKQMMADEGSLVITYGIEDPSLMYNKADAKIIKLDTAGNVLFDNIYTLFADDNEYTMDIHKDIEGNYWALGLRYFSGNLNKTIYLLKINSNGNYIVQYWIPYTDELNVEEDLRGYAIANMPDGSLLVGGIWKPSLETSEPYNLYLRRMGLSGNLFWEHDYDLGNNNGYPFFAPASDTSLLVYACVTDDDNDCKTKMFNITMAGDTLNNRSYENINTSLNFPGFLSNMVSFDNYNTYYGLTENWIANEYAYPWVWKFNSYNDSIGSFLWSYTMNELGMNIRDISTTPDGGLIFAGYTTDPLLPYQIGWVVKMDTLGNMCHEIDCFEGIIDSTQLINYMQLYEEDKYHILCSPNHVIDHINIEYTLPPSETGWWRLFDANGMERRSTRLIDQQGNKTMDLRYCEPGLYHWGLYVGHRVIKSGKIMVSR